jgi:demethylmenaquinone methyltransferase/2-methoxy-6-polyprenyl-1,4-benzoquinol methylase
MVDRDPARIRAMFGSIAPSYDRANRILSLSRDAGWRRLAVRELLPGPGRVLDLAAGTGDLSVTLRRQGGHRVTAADFTLEMLVEGREKLRGVAPRVAADALNLPFHSASFDGYTVAFGVRNFFDVPAALREAARVLRHGGVAGILELSTPRGPLRPAYRFYFNAVLPRLGGLITGRPSAYRYLPQSVDDFPEGEAFMSLMREAGFEQVTARRLSGGIATYYRGVRA